MKQSALAVLSLLGLLVLSAQGAPLEQGAGGVESVSCQDAQALGAAGQALTKINEARQEGFILSLYRMASANIVKHGETGVVFYLTLDVEETDCHVLSRKDWKKCKARTSEDTPVYGQCKASIFISKVHRVVRLYKYDCTIRPVPAEKVVELCPDCASHIAMDDETILSTASKSLEKFNKDSGLANRFALLSVSRATMSMGGMATFYNVQYTIQETSCANSADATNTNEECPTMDCEFAHKGHCKGSLSRHPGGEDISVECEIYEPVSGEKEKAAHLLGGETDHSHTDSHTAGGVDHTHDGAHDAQGHPHDHAHDHTKSHAAHDATLVHAEDSDHHHTHDHPGAPAHAHPHSHDHGHGHDHVHAHHAKAHDHAGDRPNQHHAYHPSAVNAPAVHTHEHDHELALDHDHAHAHLHEHEHHHHHHEHPHETHARHPEGEVRLLPALGQPVALPSFPDRPVGGDAGVALIAVEDPEIPGQMEPTILAAFPTAAGSGCPAAAPAKEGVDLVAKLFAEDPMFKAGA